MIGRLLRNLFSQKPVPGEKPNYISFSADGIRHTSFRMQKKDIRRLERQWKEYMVGVPPFPDKFEGKGIVIAAGGIIFFTCAWVNIHSLRKHGCKLPIEVWYVGSELTPEVIRQLERFNVTCVDALAYGWCDMPMLSLKPFSIINSRFKEVLYLDADIVAVADPTFLFEGEQYLQSGAVFWPDFWKTDKSNPIWKITASSDYGSFEQESGQILVDKEKSWKELQLCLHFNLSFQDYYKILLGDKDTFKFAWLALKSSYYMIPAPTGICGFEDRDGGFCGLSMVQYDYLGNVIFIHRNWLKWDFTKDDEPVWMELKRISGSPANGRPHYVTFVRDDISFTFFDFKGEVFVENFSELFGDLELYCLEVLKELRRSEFYAKFLLHTYFVHFRPGNPTFMGNLSHWRMPKTKREPELMARAL